MVKIKEYQFNRDTSEILRDNARNVNWPVVYIICGKNAAYIGETVSAVNRMRQHWDNPARKKLTIVHIIYDNHFTKSSILDVESSLIQLMGSDNQYSLQNGNNGISYHHYYNMSEFSLESKFFKELWNQLKKKGLVVHELHDLLNSDLFKYSPYKSLNEDQLAARDFVIGDLLEAFRSGNPGSMIVEGESGTGKTILGLYLLYLLTNSNYDDDEEEDIAFKYVKEIKEMKALIQRKEGRPLQAAYVVAMVPLRNTLKKVCAGTKGLKADMVIGPSDLQDKTYDVLIVDEAHRLKRPVALGSEIGAFRKVNQKLGFDPNKGTQLDWIQKQSKCQIFFYDSEQSVRPSDIRPEDFSEMILSSSRYVLQSQMRCKGGNDYIHYVKQILKTEKPAPIRFFKDYDFVLFDHIEDLTAAISEKNNHLDLCRILAGYSWKWTKTDANGSPAEDIEIEGHHYLWNVKSSAWILSVKDPSREFGCIHTSQGYDLNYCGVIFGNEIDYDPATDQIVIDRSQYFDINGKKLVKSEKELHQYIINIYATLMTRGILGTYVYACRPNLREYLRRYIPSAKCLPKHQD